MAKSHTPVALVDYPAGSRNEAGEALGEDFSRRMRPIIASLIDAGFDPRHIEGIMARELAWIVSSEILARRNDR